jgi:NAD(P)-dependent dehydrogenase (short-subunit alcohol dehydrogenase family)
MTDSRDIGRGAVVVTGTSSGIGRATALELDRIGFRVYGSVRKESDAVSLAAASARITPIIMDVVDEKSVRAAAQSMAAELGERGLGGLVNNAGIGTFGPIEGIPIAEWRRQLEVNVIGPVTVTQAFLPLLRKGRGRIVNIGSIGGITAIPFGGALCASKHAVEAINDALRMELRQWGIAVSLVAPGSIHTTAANRMMADGEAMMKMMPVDRLALYEKPFRRVLSTMSEDEGRGSPPEVVAKVVARALTDRRPKTRYPAGRRSVMLAVMAKLLPPRVFDAIKIRQVGL